MSSCSRHASKEAVGACINCGKLVCAACHKEIDGKSYCPVCVEKLFTPTEIKPDKTTPSTPTVAKPVPLPAEREKTAAALEATSVKAADLQPSGKIPVTKAAGAGQAGVSWVWWIPPAVLGWIGGLISWLVNKASAPKTARNMLIGGIGISVLQGTVALILIISLVAGNLPNTTQSPITSQQKQGISSTSKTEAENKTVNIDRDIQQIEPIKLTTLITQTLNASDDNQTVNYRDQVSVNVPGSTLKEQQEITISSVDNAPELSRNNTVILSAYDISFSKQHEFDQPLTFEFAYDPAQLPNQNSPDSYLAISFLSSDRKTWLDIPKVVDINRSRVTVQTYHNGTWVVRVDNNGKATLQTDHFLIEYTPADFQSSLFLGFRGCLPAPEDAIYAKYPDAPRYVVDCAYFLERAWDAYKRKDTYGREITDRSLFDNIGWGRIPVNIALERESPYYSSLTKVLYLGPNQDCNNTWNSLEGMVSHEFFHVIQTQDYGLKVMQAPVGSRDSWWLESMAEYAGFKIASEMDVPTGNSIALDYFALPFNSNDEKHAYAGAYFFDFLHARKGQSIPALYQGVGKEGDFYPKMVTYIKNNTVNTQGEPSIFADNYRDFAEYILLDPHSPLPVRNRPKGDLPPVYRGLSDVERIYDLDLAYGPSTQFILIKPTIERSIGKRTLKVLLDGSLEDGCRVDIYHVTNYDGWQNNSDYTVNPLATWDNHAAKVQISDSVQDVDMREGDGLIILVTNYDMDHDRRVNLKVVDVLETKLSIIMPKTSEGKGIICTSYDFERESPGYPPSTKYIWRIDGYEVEGDRLLKHTFDKSGDYKIELEAILAPYVNQSGTNKQQAQKTSRTFTVAKPKLIIIPLWPAGEPAPPGYIRFTVQPENMAENADYTWYIDGSRIEGDKNGASFEFTMPKDSYTVEVVARCDKTGKSEEVRSSIRFKIVELQIGIRAKPSVGTVGELTTFRVGGSTMPSDTIYTWNFGDGKGEFESSEADGMIGYSYDKLNSYTVKVTAKGKRSGLFIARDEIPYKVDGVPSVTIRMPVVPINPEIVNIFYADPRFIPEDALYEWYLDEESVLTAKGSEGREAIAPKGFLSAGDHHMLVMVKWKDEDARDKWVQASVNFKVAASKVSLPVINNFNTSTASVNEGYCAKLTWDVSGADTVILNPGGVSLPASGMHPGCLTSDTTFVLTATNKAGSVKRSVNVKFIPNTPTPAPVPTPSPTPAPASTPSADNEEVTFAVYRELTTTFSDKTVTKSKQYCQSFTVTIYRVEGLKETFIPASGNSIARNGSYSITLPVGHYRYKVNGSYTNPDGNSSGAAGFDVIKDGRNFVEVVDYASYNPK